ncbi:polysaccharide deacetylase family protein [Paenibacillus paeoniae]|uniref:Polysaccharide deacetylase family protein n=1 Tax=Paenibacillus paeoniae TaxID=2292705 RepID=A0A371PID3_9BACL|nr:polysaccharide deacetylase family protein [Paenibacillus paeoniae]REK75990.1 polysaccharide deacetylase family protein [Paenibacillus paeoniae]
MENLFLWGFYVMTFYAFLPGMISRTFGFRVFKKGKVDKEIALTFDDGPDPVYTPQLLNLLARYNAKATFFVVGSHAEGQGELLRRMQEEGHTIGIHNYVHKSNWFMRPRTVRRHIEKTNDIIEQATGTRSIYYRPPWGIINVFDYSNLGYLRIILWSAMFGDWRKSVGAKRLQKRMMKKLRPGEVLLLHDCGNTLGADHDAPRNMMIALEAYMEAATKKGYTFVGIEEMMKLTDVKRSMHRSLFKRMIISLWLMWEHAFHILFRLKKVGSSDTPAFHYRVTTYNGDDLKFAEGGSIAKGDSVAELHFDNRMLSNITATSRSPLATGIRMLREVERALPQLADQLSADPDAKHIKAVYGVTMVHRGADRLGFEIFKLKEGLFAKSTRIYLKLLLKVLTNTKQYGKERKQKSRNEVISPRMLLMPVQKIVSYANEQSRIIKEEVERVTDSVDRAISGASEDNSTIASKTSAI